MSIDQHRNHLAHEKSPYLLQHKDNPVWWFAWGPKAFEAAKTENKIIFLSVGYSTCHWCHVMEKDSFEKQDVADVLNSNYISVKLDREERPDIDSVYMNAVQAMHGSGGWPMTVLLTPEGHPFWGGTFIPRPNLIELLTKVAEVWRAEPGPITEGSNRLVEFLKNSADLPRGAEGHNFASEEPLRKFFENFRSRFDNVYGGSKGAPKFPPALALSALLRVHHRSNAAYPLQMVEKTLDQMRRGGIYDQLGGGFHRYAVDDHWLIPHFEKMLYDNALLTQVYLEAFQVTQKADYARTAIETLDYVMRDMTDTSGAFYSAEDADSENIEGKFYVWSLEELKEALAPAELGEIVKTFRITPQGNFHAHVTGDEVTEKRLGPPALTGNVLFIDKNEPLPDSKNRNLMSAMKKLFELRARRIRPHLDDKILVSWNGLMISAFAKGYQVLGEERYLKAAQKAITFILENMLDDQKHLVRSYRDGVSPHRGMGDDYANLIEACLNLYESDFNRRWYDAARDLQNIQDQLFFDDQKKAYFENDGTDTFLITRNKSFEDGVVPSTNSVTALNLVRLTALSGDLKYENRAREVINAAGVLIEKYPQASAKLLQAIDRLTDKGAELAIVTPSTNDPGLRSFLKDFWSSFRPNITIAIDETQEGVSQKKSSQNTVPILRERLLKDQKITFYVCRQRVCELPTNDATQTLADLEQKNNYGL